MRIIPNETPAPRLALAATAQPWSSGISASDASGKLSHGSWTGNAFAIFAGCSLGLVMLCGASTFVITQHTPEPMEEAPRLISIAAPKAAHRSISTPQTEVVESKAQPTPVTVQITPDLFKVTAVSLGHPRVAVINRQHVSEGDWIEVETPTARVGVKLQVIKIADGNLELVVGEHVLTVPVDQLKLKRL